MGFDDIDTSGDGGFALYDKGENALLKLSQVLPKENDFYDPSSDDSNEKDQYEVELRFDSVSEHGENHGEVAWYPTAKITVGDSENMTSHMALLLKESGVMSDVLEDLGADEEIIEKVKNGEKTWYATEMSEAEELGKSIATNLKGVILRAGTKVIEPDDGDNYSRVKEIFGTDDSDNFEKRIKEVSGEEESSDEDSDSEDDEDVIFGEDEEEEE